jgi:hypothetical protein
MTTFRLFCLVALVGCADRELDTEPPADSPATPAPLDVLARIDRGGSNIQWVRPPGAPAGMGAVVITGRTGEPPLLDLDTAEKMRPVELYLAFAGDTRIPDRLAPYATDADRALVAAPAQLTALRQRVAERGAALAKQIADATPDHEVRVASCTAAQIATARSVFGKGYSDGQTCGDHLGFIDTYPTYLYCNGGACGDYVLGRTDGYECPLDPEDPCDYAEATVHALSMRSYTGGNPHFLANAHRIRGFAYNCTGDGNLTMNLRYGGPAWDTSVAVAPGNHTGLYYWGSAVLQDRTIAIDLVGNGHIFDGIAASGSTYQPVEYLISGNAGANDRGIFCTDTQQSLTMTGRSDPQNCGHGNVSWCHGYCGGCFE